jgi:methyltransferase (TIGR00027 family)
MGGRQFVQLGAGFDSVALRNPHWMKDVHIFELDHPETQSLKRDRIKRNKYPVPECLELVPIDFEKESIDDRLMHTSFDRGRPTFFSWLGVIYYLSDNAISNVLDSITKIAEPNSEIILDFLVPEECVESAHRDVYANTCAYTARLGEPYVSFQSPTDIKNIAFQRGLEVVNLISDSEIDQQYFKNRHDDLAVMRGCGIAHLKISEIGNH